MKKYQLIVSDEWTSDKNLLEEILKIQDCVISFNDCKGKCYLIPSETELQLRETKVSYKRLSGRLRLKNGEYIEYGDDDK